MPETDTNATPPFKIRTIDISDQNEIKDHQVPTFVNQVNLWRYGADIYFDMALLTIEQLDSLKPGCEVAIAVHDRYVMSQRTFADFASRVGGMLEQLKKEGAIPDARSSG